MWCCCRQSQVNEQSFYSGATKKLPKKYGSSQKIQRNFRLMKLWRSDDSHFWGLPHAMHSLSRPRKPKLTKKWLTSRKSELQFLLRRETEIIKFIWKLQVVHRVFRFGTSVDVLLFCEKANPIILWNYLCQKRETRKNLQDIMLSFIVLDSYVQNTCRFRRVASDWTWRSEMTLPRRWSHFYELSCIEA